MHIEAREGVFVVVMEFADNSHVVEVITLLCKVSRAPLRRFCPQCTWGRERVPGVLVADIYFHQKTGTNCCEGVAVPQARWCDPRDQAIPRPERTRLYEKICNGSEAEGLGHTPGVEIILLCVKR